MKTILFGAALVSLAAGGAALAQAGMAPQHDWKAKDETRAEAQAKAEALFARLDVNHDGKLDQADRAAHEMQMFDRMDTNHDGVISREEFAAAHAAPGAAGDGAPGEKREHGGHGGMRHGMRGGPGPEMGMMLRMADTNHDGVVTKDEFVAAALKHFDMADTNHDGVLTAAERKAARARMGAMMRDHAGMGRHHAMGGTGEGDMPPPPPPPPAN